MRRYSNEEKNELCVFMIYVVRVIDVADVICIALAIDVTHALILLQFNFGWSNFEACCGMT